MFNKAMFIIGFPLWILIITLVWFLSNIGFLGLEPATFSACYDVFKEFTGVK